MDFHDVVNQLIGVVVLLLTSMVTVLVPIIALYLKKKWGLEVDEKQRAQLTSAINNGIAYGAQVVKASSRPMSKTEAVNTQIEEAKEYVKSNAPDALAHFGSDLNAPQLEKKIIAQLPNDQAPGTQTLTAPAGSDLKITASQPKPDNTP